VLADKYTPIYINILNSAPTVLWFAFISRPDEKKTNFSSTCCALTR